jgi:hypothetical protein
MHKPSVGTVVFTATAVHLALLINYLLAFAGDASAFVCADRDKIGRSPFEAVDTGFPNGGYDGQWCYIIARHPWTQQAADVLDLPAYRHVRILYPALAWLLSGGGHLVALLWVMPLINLVAIAGIVWYGAHLAIHYGRSPWWGFVLPVVLNAGMPALRDLTDPLATAALVAMLATYWSDGAPWHVAVWAAAAALGREQNSIILLLTILDAVGRRRWRPATALAAALAVWLGWVTFITTWYGTWPTSSANVAAPLSGIAYCVAHLSGRYGRPAAINILGLSIVLFQLALCGLLVLRRPQPLTAAIALAGVALALFGGPAVYESAWSYSRVFVWMPLAVWLWSVQSGRTWPTIPLTAAVAWPLLASVQAWLK